MKTDMDYIEEQCAEIDRRQGVKPASSCTSRSDCSPRFVVVSDLPEYTVYDREQQLDMFPTKSGNRDYACRGCDSARANMIADALNFYVANS